MSTSSMDAILYLILSLVTLIKLLIVFISSKHDMITQEFIGFYIIELLGPRIFTIILLLVLIFITLLLKLISKSKRYTIISLIILIISFVSIYNVNIVI